jgi:hypothetical protein
MVLVAVQVTYGCHRGSPQWLAMHWLMIKWVSHMPVCSLEVGQVSPGVCARQAFSKMVSLHVGCMGKASHDCTQLASWLAYRVSRSACHVHEHGVTQPCVPEQEIGYGG